MVQEKTDEKAPATNIAILAPVGVDLSNPDVAKLLADPALFKRLRKAHRGEMKGALNEIAETLIRAAIEAAKAEIVAKTGKSVKHVVVSRDGDVRVALYMIGPRDESDQTESTDSGAETADQTGPAENATGPADVNATDPAPSVTPEASKNGTEPKGKRGKRVK